MNAAKCASKKPLKTIGIVTVRIALHPDVDAQVEVNIARSEDEAERQARGENVLAREEDVAGDDEDAAEEKSAEFFDLEAQAAVADQDGDNSEGGEEASEDNS